MLIGPLHPHQDVKSLFKQKCIPVGCVPNAVVATTRCLSRGGGPCPSVSLSRGGLWPEMGHCPEGVSVQRKREEVDPPVNRMTDRRL